MKLKLHKSPQKSIVEFYRKGPRANTRMLDFYYLPPAPLPPPAFAVLPPPPIAAKPGV